MKFRVVQLPFRDVSYASMSRDGNWIVFPAADDRGKFDVYMMNVSQGQPRRITHDSCYSHIQCLPVAGCKHDSVFTPSLHSAGSL